MVVNKKKGAYVIPLWEKYVEELGRIDELAYRIMQPWITDSEKEYLFKELEKGKESLSGMRKILDEQDLHNGEKH